MHIIFHSRLILLTLIPVISRSAIPPVGLESFPTGAEALGLPMGVPWIFDGGKLGPSDKVKVEMNERYEDEDEDGKVKRVILWRHLPG